jgi:hypothetical protein
MPEPGSGQDPVQEQAEVGRLAYLQRAKPLWALLLPFAGFPVGYFLVTAGAAPSRPPAFSTTREFDIYAIFTGLQTALWFLVAWPAIATVKRLWRHGRGAWMWILPAALLVGATLASQRLGFKSGLYPPPLHHHAARNNVLLLLGAVPGFAALVGIWLVDVVATRTAFPPTERGVDEYRSLRADLERLRLILAAIVGMLVLSTGAYRNAVVAGGVTSAKGFPSSLVLVYGASFTIIVALAYVPTYLDLLAAGRGLRDRLVKAQHPADVADLLGKRRSFEEALELRADASERFQSGFTILAPLISAVISVSLGKG